MPIAAAASEYISQAKNWQQFCKVDKFLFELYIKNIKNKYKM